MHCLGQRGHFQLCARRLGELSCAVGPSPSSPRLRPTLCRSRHGPPDALPVTPPSLPFRRLPNHKWKMIADACGCLPAAFGYVEQHRWPRRLRAPFAARHAVLERQHPKRTTRREDAAQPTTIDATNGGSLEACGTKPDAYKKQSTSVPCLRMSNAKALA